jgi:hypothetical protein
MEHASGDRVEPRTDRVTTGPNGRPLPAELRHDFAKARRWERQRFLAQAREIFGEPLAEVILTHDLDHLIGLEAAADGMTDEEIKPLRNAVSIANDMTVRVDFAEIRAWFVGLNDMLDDREPALVIRDDPSAVRAAARALLAYG